MNITKDSQHEDKDVIIHKWEKRIDVILSTQSIIKLKKYKCINKIQ